MVPAHVCEDLRAHVLERQTECTHTHMPVCVILVLSRRQRPKASDRPQSWSYFSLWPGVTKLWCSKKTSWVFFAFFEVLHNYRRQMTGAVRLLFSRLSENKMWKACKQEGWDWDKAAAEHLLLREGENWESFMSHKSSQHTHTHTRKSNSGSSLLLPMASLYLIIWYRLHEGNCVTVVTYYK